MLVTTIYGEMDDARLEKRTGVKDDDVEHTTWVEYWLGEELVHRSVHVTLKQGLELGTVAGGFV